MRNHRTPLRRRLFRFPAAAIGLVFAGVALLPAHAGAYQARVRWAPNPNAAVIGYKVYLRPAQMPYPAPVNVGMPRRASDGTMSWDVGGLVRGKTYYFAVSAYTSRVEGWLSNEIPIGDTDPCLIDQCFSQTRCDFRIENDGVACGEGPCEVCRAARCTALPALDLDTGSVRLEARSEQLRVRVHGTFTPPSPVSPATTGLVFGFANPSGTMLSETVVPPGGLKSDASRTRFRIAARGAVPGLQRLNLWVSPDRVRVSAVLTGYELVALRERSAAVMVLRFGSQQCAVDPDLVCDGQRCR